MQPRLLSSETYPVSLKSFLDDGELKNFNFPLRNEFVSLFLDIFLETDESLLIFKCERFSLFKMFFLYCVLTDFLTVNLISCNYSLCLHF